MWGLLILKKGLAGSALFAWKIDLLFCVLANAFTKCYSYKELFLFGVKDSRSTYFLP
jgi:hypothetical protein